MRTGFHRPSPTGSALPLLLLALAAPTLSAQEGSAQPPPTIEAKTQGFEHLDGFFDLY